MSYTVNVQNYQWKWVDPLKVICTADNHSSGREIFNGLKIQGKKIKQTYTWKKKTAMPFPLFMLVEAVSI